VETWERVKKELIDRLSNYKKYIVDKDTRPDHYKCIKCNYTTNIVIDLIQHDRSHHSLDYRCDICNLTFAGPEELAGHESTKHSAKPKTFFQCDQCPSKFDTKRHLQQHVYLDHVPHSMVKCPLFDTCHYERKSPLKYQLPHHLSGKENFQNHRTGKAHPKGLFTVDEAKVFLAENNILVGTNMTHAKRILYNS